MAEGVANCRFAALFYGAAARGRAAAAGFGLIFIDGGGRGVVYFFQDMERYVAFDIGDKRIGVAVSDPFNTYALPSQTYFRRGFKADVAALAQIAAQKGATAIICGLPVNFDGSEGVQTHKTAAFIAALKEAVDIPVICEDERFTTMMAHEVLISEGMRREKRKNYVDALAAANILDGYLNKINKAKGQENG